jgi:prophage maintenance system killer protein
LVSAPEFLYEDVVEVMHERLVHEFGGPLGFNNENLFGGALHRPLNRWSYGEALRRCGVLAVLCANGREIRAQPAQLVTVFVAVARGRVSETELACWLRRRAA